MPITVKTSLFICNLVSGDNEILICSNVLPGCCVLPCICAGVNPVRLSDPILKATLKGIEKGQLKASKGKDPIFPVHLSAIGKVLNFKSDLETLVFSLAVEGFPHSVIYAHPEGG